MLTVHHPLLCMLSKMCGWRSSFLNPHSTTCVAPMRYPMHSAHACATRIAHTPVLPMPICPMQATMMALPPPDQWNDHVLAYLGGIGVDHYRGLLHNTVLKMKELLSSSMRHGPRHPSYLQLLDVRMISQEKLL